METGHTMDWNNWKLLSKDQKYYPLLVRESIHIAIQQPSLNKTICSVPLIIYPDISSIIRPKVKMKADDSLVDAQGIYLFLNKFIQKQICLICRGLYVRKMSIHFYIYIYILVL